MGEIKNGILSELKGSVGHITGRIVNGRNILSRKSGFRKVSTSPNLLKVKNKFRINVKFGSAMNEFDALKAVWKNKAPEGMNYFSYFVQSNYKLTGEGILSNKNIITPYGGFPIEATSSEITSTSVSITLDALTGTYNFDTAVEANVKLCVLIYLTGTTDPQATEYYLMKVDFDAQAFQADSPLVFTKSLLKADQVIFESYTDHKVYAAIVTLDAENNPVNYSSTICIE